MSKLTPRQQEAATVPTYAQYRSLIPPLSSGLHKGQGGRVGILGGSADYTGAPFFSGMGALRLGADICHIICDEDAATTIKSYSPDLIVHPYIKIRATTDCDDEKKTKKIWTQTFDDICAVLKRIHVLVVGPGVSRDKGMLQCAKHAIEVAKELDIPIVIDANVDTDDEDSDEPAVQRLSKAFGGVVVIQKGHNDVISDGKTLCTVANEGGLKRSGGQGDILTGLIATSLAWGTAYEKGVWSHSHPVSSEDIALIACFGACVLNRECSRVAYEKYKRSVQSSDVVQEIGGVFTIFYDKARPNADWGEALYG
ncbi:hypothetical protein BGZ79_007703 [Entomortierella chlamydospora]|nr:hypothetical protein BGZ79_007703 [Entomortierella chlamydospora]